MFYIFMSPFIVMAVYFQIYVTVHGQLVIRRACISSGQSTCCITDSVEKGDVRADS